MLRHGDTLTYSTCTNRNCFYCKKYKAAGLLQEKKKACDLSTTSTTFVLFIVAFTL